MPGDVLFNYGDTQEVIYIVKQGLLVAEADLTIEDQNKVPIDKHTWEIT